MSTIKNIKLMTLALVSAVGAVSCDKNDNNDNATAAVDFSGTYTQQDQMGRPAINTVFVASGQPKDDFNGTIPSEMGAKYRSVFKTRLLALNSGYTTNALTLNADAFTGVLATDVLGVSTTGKTTFFDGTNVLTGRALGDDVIDTELLLIFGGPNGTANAGLTKDNVNKNDKDFTAAFPYLATAW
ncbi:hypothetical protein FFWV33_13880 [Flavobacterium faecale]|uniref:DUF4331 domain-containing protein n=1 Tax=Flavobacterium faecale TaxID=1355330 RepID=A0A2S1LFQ8_9FLAO|nr:DUF4331 family protein [Flavobacterium faecale]AWG22539.1 hypothetical protein FFWV33_13880 [Flavobacterium faecale]